MDNKKLCKGCGFPQSFPIPHEHDRTDRENAIIKHFEDIISKLKENNENDWWTSSTGQIELQMTIEQANSVSHSGDCQADCIALLNTPDIKEQLDKYTPEIIKQVIDEYTDWDDNDWKEEIESGELTIEDIYKLRLLWIAGGDISDYED